ncbi:hypothetical protein LCE32_03515 [Streptomyces sp. 7G]|uniref:hypothetical protein n=1 Tax=Streptomyces sp. 7G TaxID=2877241 RepID=UPI001CD1AEFD|nr:hypothetical protein [Streptomyces sp. 7G]MCA1269151.1 hypothetical protein [Streptomyces sp. 7G]
MDDLDTLRTLRSNVPPPDQHRLDAGESRLEAAIGRRPARFRPRGRGLALVGTPAAVALIVVAATIFGSLTPDGGQRVEYGSVAEPRDDQWIYRRTEVKTAGLNFADDLNPVTREETPNGWKPFTAPVKGENWVKYGTGERRTRTLGTVHADADTASWPSPKEQKRLLAKLPEDPPALLRALRAVIPIDDELQGSKDNADYRRVVLTLSTVDFIPPRARAAMVRTLKTIPGVRMSDRPVTDLLGRPALVVSRTDGASDEVANLREEMLIDPETFAYRGKRNVYLAGGKIDGVPTEEDRVVSGEALVRTEVRDHAPSPSAPEPGSETGSPERAPAG